MTIAADLWCLIAETQQSTMYSGELHETKFWKKLEFQKVTE